MRRCSGQNTREWGLEAIFEIACPDCGQMVEFFKDEIRRRCRACRALVTNDRPDQGCGQRCRAESPHQINRCPNFRRSKDRFITWDYHYGLIG